MRNKTKALLNFIVGLSMLISATVISIFCPAEVLYSKSGIWCLIYVVGAIILGSTLVSVSADEIVKN